LGLHVSVAGLECQEIISCISELRVGAIQRQPELQIVELEQYVTFRDLLIVANRDFTDNPGYVG